MYCLRIFHEKGSEIVPLLEPTLTLGSAPENEIILSDPEIPSVALRMFLAEGGLKIALVQTRVKFSLNGKRCEEGVLKPGDRLELGSYALILDHLQQLQDSEGEKVELKSNLQTGLTKLCALVATERDLQTLVTKIMGLLIEVFKGNEAFLFTLDPGGKPNVFVSFSQRDSERLFSDTIVAQVLQTRKGVFIQNAFSDPAYAHSKSISDLRLQSVLCCPILAGGELSGLIYLGSNTPSVSFGSKDFNELEVYSMVTGCLINHVGYIAMQSKVLASLQPEKGRDGVVAMCSAMEKVMDEVEAIAISDLAILLQGETGTGKDVFAQLVHKRSRRREKPFLAVNCSTLRGELMASELFGHRKGAFTGALQDQKGLFTAAHGGTLFLDEIGELESGLQAMLLRVLETGLVRPVGQTSEIQTDVRIICATNRNLEERVAEGRFRQDLFYRINQHSIHLPALRDRGEDIQILAFHFLEKVKSQYKEKNIIGFHPDTLLAIGRYAWPGNVRELINMVHKSVLFANSPLVKLSFPDTKANWISLDDATKSFQLDYIQKALAACLGEKDKAAALLGIGRSTLFRHLADG